MTIKKTSLPLDIFEQLLKSISKVRKLDVKIEYLKLMTMSVNYYENYHSIWIRFLVNTSNTEQVLNLHLASVESLFITSLYTSNPEKLLQILFTLIYNLQESSLVLKSYIIHEISRLLKIIPAFPTILLEKFFTLFLIRFFNESFIEKLALFLPSSLKYSKNRKFALENKCKVSHFKIFLINYYVYDVLFQLTAEVQYYKNLIFPINTITEQLTNFYFSTFTVEMNISFVTYFYLIKLICTLELNGKFYNNRIKNKYSKNLN